MLQFAAKYFWSPQWHIIYRAYRVHYSIENLGRLLWTGTRMNKIYIYMHLLHTSRMKNENISCSISHRKFVNWMIDAEKSVCVCFCIRRMWNVKPSTQYKHTHKHSSLTLTHTHSITVHMNILYKWEKLRTGDLYIRSYGNQSRCCWCA